MDGNIGTGKRDIGISEKDIGIGHIGISSCISYSEYRLYWYQPNIA
jgi:hypothetical protein